MPETSYLIDAIQRIHDTTPEPQKTRFREDIKNSYRDQFEKILEDIVDRAVETPSMGILDITNTKFARMLLEAVRSYEFGLYLSTIAMCGSASERLCMDILANSDLKLRGKSLNDDEMSSIFRFQHFAMIELLHTWQLIDSEIRKSLISINEIRNRHIHPDKPPFGLTKDKVELFKAEALKALKNLKKSTSKLYLAKVGTR